MSKVARKVISIITGVALFVCLFGLGYSAVAYIPQTSGIVTGFTCTDEISPFDKTQLVETSVATRDYAVGSNDRGTVMDQIKRINKQIESPYAELSNDQLELAPEQYTLDKNALSHLDDCHKVFEIGKYLFIVCIVIMLLGSFIVGVKGDSAEVGIAYWWGGVFAIFATIAIGVWAFTSWDSFFTTFHSMFFENGSWLFANDSLLICMYPEAFWTTMGIIWAVVTILCSVIFMLVGRWMRR